MKKRRQHYVWQNYLRPFCYKSKMIYCLYDQKIKGLSTKDIAVEKDIYRLKELTKEETDFLLKLFEAKDYRLINDMNKNWVTIFNAVFELKKIVAQQNMDSINSKIDELEQNLSENLHMNIEATGFIYLNSLYKGDASFFNNDEECSKFILFLFVQYFRTKKMKNSFSAIDGMGHLAFEKAWNIMVFIMATNVGMRIYAERDRWELLILKNQTNIPFITSDQPIVNLYVKNTLEENAKLRDDEVELYYPVSPLLAVVLKKKDSSFMNYQVLNEDAIDFLNRKIKKESHLQLFSNSEAYLDIIKSA